jgi:hypothetical protein
MGGDGGAGHRLVGSFSKAHRRLRSLRWRRRWGELLRGFLLQVAAEPRAAEEPPLGIASLLVGGWGWRLPPLRAPDLDWLILLLIHVHRSRSPRRKWRPRRVIIAVPPGRSQLVGRRALGAVCGLRVWRSTAPRRRALHGHGRRPLRHER